MRYKKCTSTVRQSAEELLSRMVGVAFCPTHTPRNGLIACEPQCRQLARETELAANQEPEDAHAIAKQIDYLGGMPTVTAKPVRFSEKAEERLQFDLDNENETIRNYRQRVRQCEALGEYALAEHIREILVNEQEHQIDLATALGVDVPDVTSPAERA